MKCLKFDNDKYTVNQLDEIVDYFLCNKVVVYPTDTIYGIGCLAGSERAIKKVYKIKKRCLCKKPILLMRDFDMVYKYCEVSKKQNQYLKKVWTSNKKAVTVILKSKGLLPSLVENKDGGVAVRIPKNKFVLDLLKKINKPIISTSLNIADEPLIEDLNDIKEKFKILPDLVVCAQINKNETVSSVIDITNIKNIRILRK